MISFEQFMMSDGSPIYLQILLYIKRGIIAGIICDGDELPSRRVLSALLGVNPNTVQKAYKMLEDEGLIVTDRTNGKFVASSSKLLESQKNKTIKHQKPMRRGDREVQIFVFCAKSQFHLRVCTTQALFSRRNLK